MLPTRSVRPRKRKLSLTVFDMKKEEEKLKRGEPLMLGAERINTDEQLGVKSEVQLEFKCEKVFSKQEDMKTRQTHRTCEDLRLSFANVVFYSDSEEEPEALGLKAEPDCVATDDPYVCHHCTKVFTSKVFKTLHSAAVQRAGSCQSMSLDPDQCNTCTKCDLTSYRKDSIKRHERSCKSTNSKEFGCSKCGKKFLKSSNLELHSSFCSGFVQNPRKPFACCECGKGFTREDARKSHELGCSNPLQNIVNLDDAANNSLKANDEIQYGDLEEQIIDIEKVNSNVKPNRRERSITSLDTASSTLSESTVDSIFQPSLVSTPSSKWGLANVEQDHRLAKSFSNEFKENAAERSIIVNVASDTSSFCDIDQLLESDDESELEKEGPEPFAKDDIVWEMWYSNAVAKGRVKDCDLNTSLPLVIAQLCVVTSVKKVRGKGEMVGLLPVPTDGRVLDLKLSGHTNNVKFVRKFSTLLENRQIVNSQRYRMDFQTVVEQVDCVERYLTNHVGLETVPDEEVMGFRQFLGLEGFEKCIYLEGLRRLKKGLSKEIPHRGDSFEESLVSEGVYAHIKNNEVDDTSEITAMKKKEVPLYNDDSYLETLDQEMNDLVSNLKDNWPFEWMKNKSEIAKLKRIMTRKKKCRRHELFMDSKQRTVRGSLPELIKTCNTSFMNIFGKKRESLDRDVRIFLRQEVFNKTMESKDFDPRLTRLTNQSQHCVPGLCQGLCGAGALPRAVHLLGGQDEEVQADGG